MSGQDNDVVQIYQQMTRLAHERAAINLSQGLPESRYEDRWRDALRRAADDCGLQYTASAGSPALRRMVGARLGVDHAAVLATSGCTESLAVALVALAGAGRRAIVWLEPYYSYYPGLAALAGMNWHPAPLRLDGAAAALDLAVLAEELERVRGHGVLLLNSPHNPTGMTLTDDEWAAVQDLAAATDTFVLVDDVYRDFVYDGATTPYERLLADGRAAIAGSLSKSFAATGLRVGWLLGPDPLLAAAERAHMHMSNCLPDLVQRAAVTVADHVTPTCTAETAALYRRRRDLLSAALADAGLRTLRADGGHFVSATPTSGSAASAFDLACELGRTVGVVPLPLDGFFRAPAQSWLRFSFAAPADDITVACRRLAKGFAAA